jgi:uncharacterized protein
MIQRTEIIHVLHDHQGELAERFGVKSLALFGSTARGAASAASDIDLLVEFNKPIGLFGFFALQDYLEEILGCPVDLGTPASLKPYLRDRVLAEAVHVV